MDRMCENCGCDNVPDWDDYCPNCGDKVPSGKCPFCGADVYPSNHYRCPRCGADIREDYGTHMAKINARLAAAERQRANQASYIASATEGATEPQEKPKTESDAKDDVKPNCSIRRLQIINVSLLLSIGVIIYMMGRLIMTTTAPDKGAFFMLISIVTIIFVTIVRLAVMAQTGKKSFLLYLFVTGMLYYGAFSLNESINESVEARRQLYQPRQETTPYTEDTKPSTPSAPPVTAPPKTEPRTPVIIHTPSQTKSQKAKDEEDYSRGYDDGRFSAAEGIWEDYDEDESEAYINGYQDGQGEAREEMEDERQRQQKSSK